MTRTLLFPVGPAQPKQKFVRLPVDASGAPISGTQAWMRLIVRAAEREPRERSAFEYAALFCEIEECKQRKKERESSTAGEKAHDS